MNSKQLAQWLEDRGELIISKSDGSDFIVMVRENGVLRTAEAPTLKQAVMMLEDES